MYESGDRHTERGTPTDPATRRRLSLERRVEVLEAVEDIRGLFHRYAWALDHADFGGIVACFVRNGVFAFQGATWEGQSAIRRYFVEDRKAHTAMLHYPVNVVVDVLDLDLDAGHGEAVANATLWDLFNRVTTDSVEGACLAGHYRLQATLDGTEWLIRRLGVTARWVTPMPEWRLDDDFQARPELRGHAR